MANQTPTILVVEDEQALRQTLVDTLQQAGFTVIQATNGKEGMEMALAKHPDLMLCDNLMPIMNGVDMVAQVRKDPWGATVPVIIMTNMYNVEAVNQSLQAGITDYLLKSDISIDRIVGLVQSRLKPTV